MRKRSVTNQKYHFLKKNKNAMKKIIIKLLKMGFPEHTKGVVGNDLLGIGSLLSGVYQGIQGAFDARANRRMQREQNQADRDFTLAQWERENAYNNPKAQMERLQSAGLNPNLAYGSANTVSAHSNVPQSKPLPPINNASIGAGIQNGLSSYVDLRQKKLQNDLLEVQKANMAQSIIESQTRTANINSQVKFRKDYSESEAMSRIGNMNLKFSKDAFGLKLAQDLRDNSIQNATADTKGKQLRNTSQEINNMTLQEKNQYILEDLQSRIGKTKSETKRNEVENVLKTMQAEYRKEGIELNDSMISRILVKYFTGNTDGKIYNNAMDLIKGKR